MKGQVRVWLFISFFKKKFLVILYLIVQHIIVRVEPFGIGRFGPWFVVLARTGRCGLYRTELAGNQFGSPPFFRKSSKLHRIERFGAVCYRIVDNWVVSLGSARFTCEPSHTDINTWGGWATNNLGVSAWESRSSRVCSQPLGLRQ